MDVQRSVHESFLRELQAWVWKRFPTRQLSASDIFYALKWAESGVPCCIFTDGFEAWLSRHPLEFVKDGQLSVLRFEAERIIGAYRELHSKDAERPLLVDDPYEMRLSIITQCGRETDNVLLRERLRAFYQKMRVSCQEARTAYPEWMQRSEQYYTLKARAILSWDEGLSCLLRECFEMLSEEEQASLKTLSGAERLHCMQISDEAQKIYKSQIIDKKIAKYFGILQLLDVK